MSRDRRPHFVRSDDPGYRRLMRQFANQKRQSRRGPRQAPTAGTLLGKALEAEVCAQLGALHPLSERRVLAYEHRGKRGIYVMRYKEVDAVVLEDGRPRLLVEIKMRSSLFSAIKGAGAQLATIRRLVSLEWDDVRVAMVVLLPDEPIVSVDADGESLQANVPGLLEPADSLEALAALSWPVEAVPVVVLPRSAVWQACLERGAVGDATLLDRARAESEAARSTEDAVLVASSGEPTGPNKPTSSAKPAGWIGSPSGRAWGSAAAGR